MSTPPPPSTPSSTSLPPPRRVLGLQRRPFIHPRPFASSPVSSSPSPSPSPSLLKKSSFTVPLAKKAKRDEKKEKDTEVDGGEGNENDHNDNDNNMNNNDNDNDNDENMNYDENDSPSVPFSYPYPSPTSTSSPLHLRFRRTPSALLTPITPITQHTHTHSNIDDISTLKKSSLCTPVTPSSLSLPSLPSLSSSSLPLPLSSSSSSKVSNTFNMIGGKNKFNHPNKISNSPSHLPLHQSKQNHSSRKDNKYNIDINHNNTKLSEESLENIFGNEEEHEIHMKVFRMGEMKILSPEAGTASLSSSTPCHFPILLSSSSPSPYTQTYTSPPTEFISHLPLPPLSLLNPSDFSMVLAEMSDGKLSSIILPKESASSASIPNHLIHSSLINNHIGDINAIGTHDTDIAQLDSLTRETDRKSELSMRKFLSLAKNISLPLTSSISLSTNKDNGVENNKNDKNDLTNIRTFLSYHSLYSNNAITPSQSLSLLHHLTPHLTSPSSLFRPSPPSSIPSDLSDLTTRLHKCQKDNEGLTLSYGKWKKGLKMVLRELYVKWKEQQEMMMMRGGGRWGGYEEEKENGKKKKRKRGNDDESNDYGDDNNNRIYGDFDGEGNENGSDPLDKEETDHHNDENDSDNNNSNDSNNDDDDEEIPPPSSSPSPSSLGSMLKSFGIQWDDVDYDEENDDFND